MLRFMLGKEVNGRPTSKGKQTKKGKEMIKNELTFKAVLWLEELSKRLINVYGESEVDPKHIRVRKLINDIKEAENESNSTKGVKYCK